MTNIIAFRVPPRTSRPNADQSAQAEILFFTGVRYVRDEDHEQPGAEVQAAHPRIDAVEVDRDERLKA